MIQEVLLKISSELPKAVTEDYAKHPLAYYIRNTAKDLIQESVPSKYQHFFKYKGSAGEQGWSTNKNPWLGIFHPVTHPGPRKRASQGYYIVYVFPINSKYVTFGLGQSDTEAEAKFGRKLKDLKLKILADDMRLLIPNYADRFESGPIDLSEGYYRDGYVYHKIYDTTNLPDEAELKEDLVIMLEAYDELVRKGGRNWIENENESDEHEYQTPPPDRKRRKKCPEGVPNRQQGKKSRLNPKSLPPPRSRDYNEEAKEHADYQCVISNTHKTFIRRDGNHYVEGHHVIPMSQYYNYVKDIDHISNIAVLCPNCHKKIHHGNSDVVNEILEKLFKIYGQNLINNYDCDLAKLKSYYK